MRYKARPGIICRTICDETVLIAVGDALNYCPDIQAINKGAAFYWPLIEKNMDTAEILAEAEDTFAIKKEILEPELTRFITKLVTESYIVPIQE